MGLKPLLHIISGVIHSNRTKCSFVVDFAIGAISAHEERVGVSCMRYFCYPVQM